MENRCRKEQKAARAKERMEKGRTKRKRKERLRRPEEHGRAQRTHEKGP